jgi:hypothetical protein
VHYWRPWPTLVLPRHCSRTVHFHLSSYEQPLQTVANSLEPQTAHCVACRLGYTRPVITRSWLDASLGRCLAAAAVNEPAATLSVPEGHGSRPVVPHTTIPQYYGQAAGSRSHVRESVVTLLLEIFDGDHTPFTDTDHPMRVRQCVLTPNPNLKLQPPHAAVFERSQAGVAPGS